jgi:acetyl esterase/lipase
LAPEFEYPIPIEECYIAASYLIENIHEYDLNVDKNRIIIAGDSAGANITTIISAKLRELDADTPKLQILINPPTQYFNFLLPSIIKYSYLDVWLNRPKQVLWHLGMSVVSEGHCDVLIKNQHTLLLDDKTKEKFRSLLDVDLIPMTYKQGKSYYNSYEHVAKSLVYPGNLDTKSLLCRDKNFESLVKSLFNTNISPGLADDDALKRQPKTYMIVSEFDSRKDEGLIYSERLSRAGVWVDTAFYEKGFHCSILYDTPVGNAMKMDLIKYIKANV